MGVNGYGVKQYPPDDVLCEALHQYAKERLMVQECLARLNSEFQLTVKKSRLHELNKQFNVPSPQKPPPTDIATQAVLDKVVNDVNQANGHHVDGFVKLNAQALQMGSVGLDIYGIKDQWSSFLLHLVIVPNHQLAATIGHVPLDYITKYMAIPLTFVTDRGSETGIIFANQTALHMVFAPNIDANQYLLFQFLKSVHNTPIEGLWHYGLHVYHPNKSLHKCVASFTTHIFLYLMDGIAIKQLFYWLWPKILQGKLDSFDCKIPVTQDIIDALRHEIPVSRDVSMCWVSEEFGNLAERIYEEIGCPNFMLHGGWAILQQMEEILVNELQVDELL
ncbi:hypothetical protein M404DRAFT_16415 [Pisolithus tinctorius Marx 270]|uniref:Uncharacterized protein n=1 Tax=Pisolithus tinctorius Marx 270 TaxID=870435 RepID=A0A0C3NY12_PISTI|nr:hypothetical protein M404DRAFT_16415 [Pisolithus tinctorius Marx 270]